MRLSDLDDRHRDFDVVLLQTPSSKLTIFLSDKIKRMYNINSEAIITVTDKSGVKQIKSVLGVVPPLSLRWFVEVDLDKIDSKELFKAMNESTTCIFFCTCSRYSTFKEFKEKCKLNIIDYYINYLRRPDFVYLYDGFVKSDNKLSNDLLNYAIQTYSGDIDALFELFLGLGNNMKFKSRSDIASVCGVGNISTDSFIFMMTKPLSVDVKRVIKNRVKYAFDLRNMLGHSTMYNYMSRSLKLIIQLKMLIISGVVYKSIRNLPDTYDEKSLARYQRYLYKIKTIPMSRLLRLRKCLGNKVWNSDMDILNFIYKFYEMEGRQYVLNSKGGLQHSKAV